MNFFTQFGNKLSAFKLLDKRLLQFCILALLGVYGLFRLNWAWPFLIHPVQPFFQYIGLLFLIDASIAICFFVYLSFYSKGPFVMTLIYGIVIAILSYFTWIVDTMVATSLIGLSILGLVKKISIQPFISISFKKLIFAFMMVVILFSFILNAAFMVLIHA